jgi:2-methylcitrate dehydratase PrpD
MTTNRSQTQEPGPNRAPANDVSQALAAHVAHARCEDMPAGVLRAAKRSLLDALGVIMAASTLGEGCSVFADLTRTEADAGVHPSTVLGFGFKAPAADAALVNGAGAHALDFEDAHDQAPVHPSAQTVPAALALAEARRASGRELLAALAIGADLTCRLGLALTDDPLRYGWYVPPILSAFGATAAGASLAGLSETQTLDAFSLTLGQATATAEVIDNPESLVRSVRDAFGAHAAVLSVGLAARGLAGFRKPFEGRAGLFALYARGGYDPRPLTHELGVRYEGKRVSLKPWPSCRATHPFVDAALGLATDHDLDPLEIDTVTLLGCEWARMLAEPIERRAAPSTAIDAKFSLPFTVASALVHQRLDLDSFAEPARNERSVLGLAQRIRYRGDGDASVRHEAVTRGTVEIRMSSGAVLSRHCAHPYGSPQAPITEADLVAKFMDCAAHAARPVSRGRLEVVAQQVLNLEEVNDVREVTALLDQAA